MLPKKRRIERKDFGKILKASKKLNSPHFLLNIAIDKDISPSRFSFSISKKVAKSAVDRNRLRRIGYSIIEKNLNRLETGFSAHFVYKKITPVENFGSLEKEILELLSKSSVLE